MSIKKRQYAIKWHIQIYSFKIHFFIDKFAVVWYNMNNKKQLYVFRLF